MAAGKLGSWMSAAAWLAVSSVAAADSPPIYRCESDGTVVFSDRTCGVDASLHESDGSTVTFYEAPKTSPPASAFHGRQPGARRSESESPSVRRHRREADQLRRAEERRRAACARLEQQLQDIRNRMRGGYGVNEGERMKTRQKQLGERRRQEKCR